MAGNWPSTAFDFVNHRGPFHPVDFVVMWPIFERGSYMRQIIGTCSICGGAVTLPELWGGVLPPTGTCEKCGATEKPNHGPTIPMNKRGSNVVEWPDM